MPVTRKMKTKKQPSKPVRKKYPGGRPTKFIKDIKEKILKYISKGATYRRACLLSGISESTFQDWKKTGNDAIEKGIENEFSEFSAKIQQAEEIYIDWLQQCVNKKAATDGKLALEVLARKRPEEFGKKDSLSVKNKFTGVEDSQIIEIDNSDERLDNVLNILKTIKGLEDYQSDTE